VTSVYVDASAITKLVITEPETTALQAYARGRTLVTSRVAVVEVTKAVARANPAADAGAVLSRLAIVELDAELAILAGAIGGSTLRALDAIHVASAERLAPDIEAFVTYDDRQAAAALAAGFVVEAPSGVSGPNSI
jgi:predicted nucleic acid-binding protein